MQVSQYLYSNKTSTYREDKWWNADDLHHLNQAKTQNQTWPPRPWESQHRFRSGGQMEQQQSWAIWAAAE
jgi:hypothetical protein